MPGHQEQQLTCCQRMGNLLSSVWGEPSRAPLPPAAEEEVSNHTEMPAGRPLEPLMQRPIVTGSMVYMQKQDPSVDDIGYRPVWVGLDIRSGPRSDHIQIRGVKWVRASDSDNNFLYSPYVAPEEFDAVNAFAIVNHVRTMYERALRRLGNTTELKWQWGDIVPIKVYPRAGEWANAFYSRDEKSLAFFHFKDDRTGKTVYTCRSFDIVAHEAGHAILDALKPHYITSSSPQTGALHEAFGDLTAIFALLELLDICEAIIAYSKCDLHSRGWFSMIGEEFGSALGLGLGLRNADNNLKIDEVSEEVHDLSKVFTGAVYDALVEIFELTRNIDKFDPAETLYRVGKHFASTVISGFLSGPSTNATFRDIADCMIDKERVPEYRSIMKKHFEKRKIYDYRASPRPLAPEVAALNIICGTMRLQAPVTEVEAEKETLLTASPRLLTATHGLHDHGDVNEVTRDWPTRLHASLVARDEDNPCDETDGRDATDGTPNVIPIVRTDEDRPTIDSPGTEGTSPFPVENLNAEKPDC